MIYLALHLHLEFLGNGLTSDQLFEVFLFNEPHLSARIIQTLCIGAKTFIHLYARVRRHYSARNQHLLEDPCEEEEDHEGSGH